MLYPPAVFSHRHTDPGQLRAALSCSLCSSIPPRSRKMQPQLMQVLLCCILPLACPKALIPLRWEELLGGDGRWFCGLA